MSPLDTTQTVCPFIVVHLDELNRFALLKPLSEMETDPELDDTQKRYVLLARRNGGVLSNEVWDSMSHEERDAWPGLNPRSADGHAYAKHITMIDDPDTRLTAQMAGVSLVAST
jgi:hypothetical protein